MARAILILVGISIAASSFVPIPALAQSSADLTLFVDPYPSPYISDWEVQAGIVSLTVMNGEVEQDLVIVLTIQEPGGRVILEAESDPQFFGANETLVYGSTSELSGSLDYDSSYEDDILRTGRLPEGEFRVCVRAEDPFGVEQVPEQCVSFTILFPDPAYLLAPFDGETVRSVNPLFQWTPLQLPVGFDLHFLLQVAEVLEGQTPYEALTSNVLHFEEDDITFESFEYPLEAAPLEEGSSYAWWVQALDQDGLAVTGNLGRSEIWTFSYSPDGTEPFVSGDPQTLQLLSADQASGPLSDFDNSSFDDVVDRISALSAEGAPIQLPLALDTDFAPIDVDAVQIYVDTQRKSLAIRGQKNLRGRSYDIMFSAYWGSSQDPRRKALSIKGPQFDGFFPADGLLDGLATSNAWFIVAAGNFKLTSEDLPPEVADYFGDESVGVQLGLNFYCKSIVRRFDLARRRRGFSRHRSSLSGDRGLPRSQDWGGLRGRRTAEGQDGGRDDAECIHPAVDSPAFPGLDHGDDGQARAGSRDRAREYLEPGRGRDDAQGQRPGQHRGRGRAAVSHQARAPQRQNHLRGRPQGREETRGEGPARTLTGCGRHLRPAGLRERLQHARPEVDGDLRAGEGHPETGVQREVRRGPATRTPPRSRSSGFAPPAPSPTRPRRTRKTPPPGGVPTPFKQADLLAKQKEREEAAKKKPKKSWEGKWAASVTIDPTALAAMRPREILMDLFNFAGNLDLLPDGPELNSLSLRFLPEVRGSMVVAGSTMLMDSPTYFVASRVRSMTGGTGMLFGVAPQSWSFKGAFPDVDIPVVSELEISNVGLLFATEEFIASSDDLFGEEYGFYRSLYQRDDFMVTIKPGVNLIYRFVARGRHGPPIAR